MKKYQYRAIHTAVTAVWGKPYKCEKCHTKKAKRYEWSNKNHTYLLLRKDWWQLCAKCHRNYDRKKFGHAIPWNKGDKGLKSWHNTKGLNRGKPWNTGKRKRKMRKCICGDYFNPPKETSKSCSKSCAMKLRYI